MFDRLKFVCWNIGFIEKGIDSIVNDDTEYKIRWVKKKYHDRFYADPFIFETTPLYYVVLAEECLFVKKKGISSN